MGRRRPFIAPGLALAVLIASCGGKPSSDPLAGTYEVKGGGAALEVFQALSDGFRKQHPAVKFTFEDVGSAAGMKLAATGDVDLATSSAAPPADITNSVVVVPVGASGTAVIVGAANRVTALTKVQVRDIFAGQLTNWSAVGGDPAKIVVVVREATSALRGNFDAYFFGGKGTYVSDAIELNTGKEIIRAVTSGTGVISMVTISSTVLGDTRIRALTIEGVAPTRENVSSGRYPVIRPLFLVYSEKYVKPAIAAFLAFVRSADGKQIIEHLTTGA